MIDAPSMIPTAIDNAIRHGTWRDPGSIALRGMLSGIPDIPKMSLFVTVDSMRSVSEMVESGGYVDDPEFCMVRHPRDRVSSADARLVFSRALFIAGSLTPGDDVFVAVDDVTSDAPLVVGFDWSRPVPSRWIPLMTIDQFCDSLAKFNAAMK